MENPYCGCRRTFKLLPPRFTATGPKYQLNLLPNIWISSTHIWVGVCMSEKLPVPVVAMHSRAIIAYNHHAMMSSVS